MLQIGSLFGSHRKSCDPGSHMTESHMTRSHVTGNHRTGIHVTGSQVTGSHVTGSHRTWSHMTRSRMTGSVVFTFDDIINFCAHKVMTSSVSVRIKWCCHFLGNQIGKQFAACGSTSLTTETYHRLIYPKGTSPMKILLLSAHAYMHFAWYLQLDTQCVHMYTKCVRTEWLIAIPRQNEYMQEQTTKGLDKMNICMNRFGVHIEWRKYLNECVPFGYVSRATKLPVQIHLLNIGKQPYNFWLS